MKVPTTALMSVILVLTTLTAMSRPTFNVNVANLPLNEQGNLRVNLMNEDINYASAKSEYEVIYLGRFNITSGKAQYYDIPDWNNPVFAGGYDQLSFSYEIWDMSIGNYNLTLSVAGVTWFIAATYTLEPVYVVNTMIMRSDSSWDMTTRPPALIEIKAPYFALEFRTDTEAPNWWDIWVVIDVYAYLRNE